MVGPDPKERTVLVVQGGGALGAYQAGAYEQLALAGHEPDWVAGISIGAINAALICGNPPERRVEHLRAFWQQVTSNLTMAPWFRGPMARQMFNEFSAASVMSMGVPGFFRPKMVTSAFLPASLQQGASYYDTAPLRDTLNKFVDFDHLNDRGPRLSVGAVEVTTGNFAYFDSEKERITVDHIMASGALPPGFPAVHINGKSYWDGGLVSNTPLQYVFDTVADGRLLIFQIDLFSARGALPKNLPDVAQRAQDIRYSSRTRLTTDRYVQLHKLRAAADRLYARLPEDLRQDADMAALLAAGPSCDVTLVHLIHRKEAYEGASKDYEFSRLSMEEHWAAGHRDVVRTFAHPKWQARTHDHDGLRVFDLTGEGAMPS